MRQYVLLAYLKPVGWAFVKTPDDKIVFIRPPYKLYDFEEASENEAGMAIDRGDYLPCGKPFNDLKSVVGFLRNEIRAEANEAHKRSGGKVINADDIRRAAFRNAPPEILMRHLDRIEYEFIPDGKYAHAVSVLTLLMEEEKVKNSTEMFGRAIRLIRTASEKAEMKKTPSVPEASLHEIYPGICKRYGEKNIAEAVKRIAGGKSILALSR